MADTLNVTFTTAALLKEDKLNYQYQLRHKPCVQNSNADGLSKLPLETKTVSISVPEETIIPLSVVNDTPVNALDVGNEFSLKIRNNEFAAHSRRKNEFVTHSRMKNEEGRAICTARLLFVIPTHGQETPLDERHPGIVRNAEIEVKVRSCVVCR